LTTFSFGHSSASTSPREINNTVGRSHGRAVDAVEPDAFSAGVVQDFDGVAVENGDDLAGKVGGKNVKWDEE
jgi:hypothetical protein